MTTASLIAVPSGARLVSLTHREIDVLGQFLRDGASNSQIARRMYLSEDTVKIHIRALLKKTQTDNRAALAIAVLAEEVYIIDPGGRRVRF